MENDTYRPTDRTQKMIKIKQYYLDKYEKKEKDFFDNYHREKPIVRSSRLIAFPTIAKVFVPPENALGFGKAPSGGELIENLVIPNRITEVFPQSFFYLITLENFIVEDDHPLFCTIDGVLFSKDKKRLIAFPAGRVDNQYFVPNGTEIIGENAFEHCKIMEVVLPPSIKRIEPDAFARSWLHICDMSKMSVNKIGARCFQGCSKVYVIRKGKIQMEDIYTEQGNWGYNHCFFVEPDKLEEIRASFFADSE